MRWHLTLDLSLVDAAVKWAMKNGLAEVHVTCKEPLCRLQMCIPLAAPVGPWPTLDLRCVPRGSSDGLQWIDRTTYPLQTTSKVPKMPSTANNYILQQL